MASLLKFLPIHWTTCTHGNLLHFPIPATVYLPPIHSAILQDGVTRCYPIRFPTVMMGSDTDLVCKSDMFFSPYTLYHFCIDCWLINSLGPRVAIWRGSARPAFPGVAIWQPPLAVAVRIWRALPHGDKNIGATHCNITSNIVHSYILTTYCQLDR